MTTRSKARLYIDGYSVPVLFFKEWVSQATDYGGLPYGEPQGGIYRIVVPDLGRWTHIFDDWALSPNMMKGCKIEEQSWDGQSMHKTSELLDTYCVDLIYDGMTKEGGVYAMIFSAATVIRNGKIVISKWWRKQDPVLRDQPVLARQEKEEQEPENEEEVKFIAKLERPNNYKGEFGFDWMRKNYEEVSSNYEELKKEYELITIEDNEYFVPWLSMFHNQQKVVLQLSIDILEGKIQKDDIIKLPPKNGIRFEPEEVQLKEANGTEIKVFCNSLLSNDTKIELLDKNDNTVGKINVVKNDDIPKLLVHFVKVKGNEPNNTYNARTFNGFNENRIMKLLSETSLNQALIKVELDQVSEIVLDVEDLIEKDILKSSGGNIPRFYEKRPDYRNTLDKIFKKKNPNFRGAVYYLSSIPPDGRQGGHAAVYPKESSSIVVAPDQVNINAKSTFVHELGHLLGLLHSFEEGTKEKYNKLIENRKKSIEKYNTKNNTKIRYDGNIISNTEYIDILNNQIGQLESILENNEFKFKQSGTDNYMDYYNTNPVSFNKWQWDIMREEIRQYHGK
jgi:hypothetical protein